MSFKESVIIPLKMFETCSFKKEKDNFLQQENYPSDVRLKLYNHERIRKRLRADKIKQTKLDENKLVRTKILDVIPVTKQPFLNSIIDIIEKNPNDIKWNNNYELFLDGVIQPEYNIIQIFRFLTKSSVVTNEADIPSGAKVVYEKLLHIGVPKTWISMTFPRVSQRVRQQLQPQKAPVLQLGEGAKHQFHTWLSY